MSNELNVLVMFLHYCKSSETIVGDAKFVNFIFGRVTVVAVESCTLSDNGV